MTRSFTPDPLDGHLVDQLIEAATRAPSAGKTQAVEFLVLEGRDATRGYWEVTLGAERQKTFSWPGLLQAPVLVLLFVDPAAYTRRYSEQDKAHTDLGSSLERWSTPYWWVDGGMAAMTILLGAEEAGLGALFFGLFDHETAVKGRFGVPDDLRAIGTIALGHPGPGTGPGRSAGRPTRGVADVLHRGHWRQVGLK